VPDLGKEKQGAELTIARTVAYELEELNSHKEKVLATLSHDLRSPLTGIIGLAEIIKENFESFENNLLKEMLDLLYKSTTEELNMLDSLVKWAKIKYASEAFSPEKIKLTLAVKNAFETINEYAVTKYIHFNNEIEDGIYVFADRKMLLSILQNIVSNSLKHTPDGGKITISARRKEDKIIVGIKDTGTGMSEEKMKNLFTPEIISLSDALKYGNGAGIGLLLVKSFIEQNKGEIWAESIEGEGSSFYFTLPAKEHNKMNMQFLNSRNDLVMEQRANLQRQL
jgi:signal transduction histidine kinase